MDFRSGLFMYWCHVHIVSLYYLPFSYFRLSQYLAFSCQHYAMFSVEGHCVILMNVISDFPIMWMIILMQIAQTLNFGMSRDRRQPPKLNMTVRYACLLFVVLALYYSLHHRICCTVGFVEWPSYIQLYVGWRPPPDFLHESGLRSRPYCWPKSCILAASRHWPWSSRVNDCSRHKWRAQCFNNSHYMERTVYVRWVVRRQVLVVYGLFRLDSIKKFIIYRYGEDCHRTWDPFDPTPWGHLSREVCGNVL